MFETLQWLEESYKIESVLSSVLPSFCPLVFLSVRFLEIDSLVFSEIMHGGKMPCVDCVKKWEKWAQNCPKSFFELYENFSRSFNLLDWSEMKVLIICYVTVELPNVGKIWLLRYGLKYFWPIKLRDSSKCIISKKEVRDQVAWFLFLSHWIGWHNFKIFEIFHGKKTVLKIWEGEKAG